MLSIQQLQKKTLLNETMYRKKFKIVLQLMNGKLLHS